LILLIIPIYAKVSFFINMSSKLHQAALDYHQGKRPGKLIVSSHKPLETREDSMGDFFKPCPSRAKAGFKKSPSG
jgi:hypothetical protein